MKSQMQTHGLQLASAKDVFLIAFILLKLLDDSFATEAPIVTISTGLVLGKRVSLRNDFLEQVDQYLGIPYAMPPIGDKRFRGTTYPVASWDDIHNATTFGPVCPQAILDVDAATPRWIQKPIEDSKPFLENMDEDCLYINVYVPLRKSQDSAQFAVVVFIHGDSFDTGAGSMYDGSVLASYGDVIVVTFNYRLGILGFLSSASSESPGNYGLMDQIAALQWVQDNIAAFHGDPGRVTLMGAGTGGACAGLLMLSNKTEGLFTQVISHSGAPLSPWVVKENPIGFYNMITRDINCQLFNSESTMECLRNVSYQTFLDLDVPTPLYSYSFGPVVDGNIVEDDPAKLIHKVTEGQRNITTRAYLTGMTKNEGFRYLSSSVDIVGRIEQNVYEQTLHGFVQNNFGSNRIASGVIRDTISYEYTDWGSGPMNTYTMTSSLQDIITDHQWVTPAVQTLKQLDKAKMTSYFYLFTHRPRGSPNPRWAGPVHLEELPFVFGAPLLSTPLGVFKSNYTKADSHISLALMTYWTNFIKTGNPNLPTSQASTDFHRHFGPSFEYENSDRWPAYTNTHQNIVYLTSKPRIRDFYRVHEISLWEHLIPQLESRLSIDEPTSRIPLETTTRDTTTSGTRQSTLTDSNLYLHISTQPAITDYGTTTVSAGVINNTQRHGYKIELSIVLAAGGLLLIINLIILGVIYYLRDRKKMESRLAAKYLAHLEEIKKKKANGRGFMQTTPDSGIGFATLLNAQNGKGANSTIGTGSHQSSRDGTIRINEDGDIEFEV